ncbi:heme exporter protein CcmD [Marinomonas piezotolerans]|uniref:Heme exporter protein D n=1 Tax=Marinomonas piezotolerans TaxID=2213058 RepID=A0A370U766_9GAMM|nr:heme exporter protein CcmD [Marinomonas piezotolerans]RDL43626.1 heme exporter protein CcmD [Marinomonas piezotolerans]
MAFENIAEFLAMGDHGVYVWSSYSIGVAVFSALIISSFLSHKRLMQQLKKRYQRELSR